MIRRRIRRLARVGAALLALALAASLALSLYGLRRLEGARERLAAEVGSAEPASFRRPEVPDSENAAVWILAAAAAIELSHEEREFLRDRAWTRREVLDTGWDEEDVARLTRLTEENAAAFELLERSLQCPASTYRIDYARASGAEPPPVIELLRAARLVWVDGRLALATGDASRAGRDLRILDRIAGSLAGESTVTTILVALAVDRFSVDLVHRLVTTGVEERWLLEEIDSMLVAHDRQASFRRALAAESSLAVVASRDSPGGGPLSWLEALLARPGERLMLAGILDDYAEIAELGGKPFASVPAPAGEDAPEPPRPGRVVTLYPNLVDAVGKLKTGETLRALARQAVRLTLARLERGAYPAARGPAGAEPYSGRQMTLEERPDGSLVLAAASALELWRERNPRPSFPGEPPFVWKLPPGPRGATS